MAGVRVRETVGFAAGLFNSWGGAGVGESDTDAGLASPPHPFKENRVMVDVPKKVSDLCKEAVKEFPNDIDKATQKVWGAVRKMKDRDELTLLLAEHGCQELVYDARHCNNATIKRDVGYYKDVKPKVNGVSGETLRVFKNCFEYLIGGRRLGSIPGEDLLPLADKELALANGHHANEDLLRWLHPKVPSGRTVEEAVKARALGQAMRRFEQKYQKSAARVTGEDEEKDKDEEEDKE
jgi:hypothetical protein